MEGACSEGWTPASNASWSAPCFRVVTEHASSLRECVEACGKHGAVPACIGSKQENDFAAALLGRAKVAWLGNYQNDTSGEADEGWERCVAGAASDFSNWADDWTGEEPNDSYTPEDCAVITAKGKWWDWPCDVPSILGLKAHCLCAGPANASSSFAEDLDELEAAWAAHMREARATVAVLYPLLAVVALLPSLLLLCRRACTGLRGRPHRRRSSVWVAAGGEAERASTAEVASTAVRSLRAAHRSAARRRLQVSGAMGQIGWALLVFGLVPPTMYLEVRPIDAVVGPNLYWALLVPPGFYLLLLALLPTDARAIRALCALCFLIFFLVGARLAASGFMALEGGNLARALGSRLPQAVVLLATAVALAPTLPCCRRARVLEPRQALRRLWLIMRPFYVGVGVVYIGYNSALLAVHPAAIVDPIKPGSLALGFAFLLCALPATAANRGRLRRWLGHLGSRGRSQADAAAAVAALVSGADPEEALALAAARFRVLPIRRLTAPDLSAGRNRGGDDARALHARTEAARLGECDAFFSHSWSDEAAPKWTRLQEWHRTFVAAQWCASRGRDATLWLDKACLDQDDVAANLRCLPVFLAGCKRLLILAGPSYPTRLWCVMEIFTFLHVGGTIDRIDILPLLTTDAQSDRQGNRAQLTAQFATFDAAKAQCFLDKDRQQLLAVVEAGFGDFKEFNKRVRAVFAARADTHRTQRYESDPSTPATSREHLTVEDLSHRSP